MDNKLNNKPSDEQKEIIESISFIVSCWGTSNDLGSPTHGSDMT